MGLLAGLTGNAAEITPAEGTELFKQVLMEDEHVVRAYQLFRDAIAFTERRLILKDAQGVTGKKIEWHSVPYRSISHFAIETAGVNDWDAELKISSTGNSASTKLATSWLVTSARQRKKNPPRRTRPSSQVSADASSSARSFGLGLVLGHVCSPVL